MAPCVARAGAGGEMLATAWGDRNSAGRCLGCSIEARINSAESSEAPGYWRGLLRGQVVALWATGMPDAHGRTLPNWTSSP
jgi:hypothetical protein